MHNALIRRKQYTYAYMRVRCPLNIQNILYVEVFSSELI